MKHRKFIDFVEDISTDNPILTEAILESYSVCFLGESYKARNARYVNVIMEAISKNHPTALIEGILQSIRDGMGQSKVAKSLLLIVPAMFGAAVAGGGGEDFDLENEITQGIQEFSDMDEIPTGIIDELKDGKSESGSVKNAVRAEIIEETTDKLADMLSKNPDQAKKILAGMAGSDMDLYNDVMDNFSERNSEQAQKLNNEIKGMGDKGPTPYSDAIDDRMNEEDMKNIKTGIDKLIDGGKDIDYVTKLANHLQNSDDPDKSAKGNLMLKVLETMDAGDAGDEKGDTKLTQSHGSNADLAESKGMDFSEDDLKKMSMDELKELSKKVPLSMASDQQTAMNKVELSARSHGINPDSRDAVQLDNGKWLGYIK